LKLFAESATALANVFGGNLMKLPSRNFLNVGSIARTSERSELLIHVFKTKALSTLYPPAEYRKWVNNKSFSVSAPGFSNRQSNT